MNIAIDIDNTICNTTKYYLELAIDYDRNILNRENTIDSSKVVPRSSNWSIEEINFFIQKIFNKNVLNIPIKKDSIFYINKLKEKGFNITFITNRGFKVDDYSDEITSEYLEINNIKYDKLMTKIEGKFKHLELFDYFIDDSIKECELALSLESCKVIMIETENNKSYHKEGLIKLKCWQEIYNYIIDISN